jgi:hypothetical protein
VNHEFHKPRSPPHLHEELTAPKTSTTIFESPALVVKASSSVWSHLQHAPLHGPRCAQSILCLTWDQPCWETHPSSPSPACTLRAVRQRLSCILLENRVRKAHKVIGQENILPSASVRSPSAAATVHRSVAAAASISGVHKSKSKRAPSLLYACR